MKKRVLQLMRVAPALLALAPVFAQPQLPAKSYAFEFTGVVDSTNGFHSFGTFPAINNHGEVAFRANRQLLQHVLDSELG